MISTVEQTEVDVSARPPSQRLPLILYLPSIHAFFYNIYLFEVLSKSLETILGGVVLTIIN